MTITFSKNAWEDYTSWFTENKNMLKKTTAGFRTFSNHYPGKVLCTLWPLSCRKDQRLLRIKRRKLYNLDKVI